MALIVRMLIGFIGAALAFASVSANMHFWQVTFADDAAVRNLFVGVSLAAAASKYIVVIYLEVFRVSFRQEKGLAVLFAVAIIYDIISGLGFSSLSRAEISSAADAARQRQTAVARQLGELDAKLAGIRTTRTIGRIEAELATKRPDTCTGSNGQWRAIDRCAAAADLKAELADAEARDAAEIARAELRRERDGAEPVRDGDPQATAVAGAINAATGVVGITVPTGGVKVGLAVLLVLFLEIGPVACARAAVARRDTRSDEPEFHRPAQPAPSRLAQPAPRSARAPLQVVAGTAHSPAGPRDPLLDALRRAARDANARPAWLRAESDGWLYFALCDAAVAAGASKSTVSRRLAKWQAGGLIDSRPSSRGVAVKVLDFGTRAA